MIKATVATQITIPGKETVPITNSIEASGVTTVYLDMPNDPSSIRTVLFNANSYVTLKLLLVKIKDNKYEGCDQADQKCIKYSFDYDPVEDKDLVPKQSGVDESGPKTSKWDLLEGPLCVLGEDRIKESLGQGSQLKHMAFMNFLEKEASLELLMFEECIVSTSTHGSAPTSTSTSKSNVTTSTSKGKPAKAE